MNNAKISSRAEAAFTVLEERVAEQTGEMPYSYNEGEMPYSYKLRKLSELFYI
jgi:hypothetical protein